ncbi:MAG: sigma 54-interacting transcriptional regulator [Planctomycetes bacterium]|nr:sigma 54-interacting transcriptional regulator [Planctomycetota bacterium]
MPRSQWGFPITELPQTIGRSPGCAIRIGDTTVSREHAMVWLKDGMPLLRDLQSQNGTRINDKRVSTCELAIGDLIQIGHVVLRVCSADEPESAQSPTRGGDSIHQAGLINAGISAATELVPTALEESKLREDLAALYSLGAGLGLCSSRSDALHLLLGWMQEWLAVDQAAALFLVENRLQVKARRTGREPAGPKTIDWSTVQASLDRQATVLRKLAPGSGEISIDNPDAHSRRVLAVCIPRADPPGVIYAEWSQRDSVWDQHYRELLRAAARVLGDALVRLAGGKSRSEQDADASWITNVSGEILVGGPAMQPVRDFIRRAATADATVLITGETGTGKELVARTIHRRSVRAHGPFVARNCGAFPESLLEDELFGHEPGAFTGATKLRKGVFDQANGGTLLLDEIGEAPPVVQSELLRVLEDRSFYRIGGQEPVQVDLRIIATTNRDLTQAVAAGEFRRDLFYRLEVLTFDLPPLRQRPEDIRLLAEHLIDLACKQAGLPGTRLSSEALGRLEAHDWPGNVRELRNTINRAVILSEGATIEAEHVVFSPIPDSAGGTLATAGKLSDMERTHILEAIARAGGNKAEAARLLGIARSTLLRKLQQFKEGGG